MRVEAVGPMLCVYGRRKNYALTLWPCYLFCSKWTEEFSGGVLSW